MCGGYRLHSSTITESFFRKHLSHLPLQSSNWLKLTAANGLHIPFLGYLETNLEIFGTVIPNRGILVIRDPPLTTPLSKDATLPGISKVQEMSSAVPDLHLQWTKVMSVQTKTTISSVAGFAKVAGKNDVLVPAGSVSVLCVVDVKHEFLGQDTMVSPLAQNTGSNLLVIHTVTTASKGDMTVRVANLSDSDLWLKPKSRIGVIHAVSNIDEKHDDKVVFEQVSNQEVKIQQSNVSSNP